MKKVIIMVRTSTETQQVEDQHREMVQFCKEQGYTEEQMIFVETQGASAGKVDEEYLDMIQHVKEHIIDDRDIDCFAVWHLNRAVRNEKVFVDLKEFLVKHKVQFLVKNPYLRLLNEDGSINMGMELAFSLMSTLAKQDNEERKAKFHRAKKALSEQGRYTGGPTVKTGYKVNEDGYIVIDEEKAKLVRLIFEMYSTGKWSVRKLWEELYSRGYKINYHLVNRMVADRSYIEGRYPQMISRELWEKCEAVRKKNFISIPKGHRNCFGSGIFKCSKCGNGMLADGEQYKCRKHKKYSAPPHCPNELTIKIENMDGLLWMVASQEETLYRMEKDTKMKEECQSMIVALEEKIATAQKKLDYIEEKKHRIAELYIEGVITKEEKEKRLSGTVSDARTYNDSILGFRERIGGLLALLEGENEMDLSGMKLHSMYRSVLRESDLEVMNEIVKKHIFKVTAVATEFKGRKSSQIITIETKTGKVKRFIYVARKYEGKYFFYENGRPVPGVDKIIREPLGEGNPRAFKKLSEW